MSDTLIELNGYGNPEHWFAVDGVGGAEFLDCALAYEHDRDKIHQRFLEIEEQSEKETPYLYELSSDVAKGLGVNEHDWRQTSELLEGIKEHSCNMCNHCMRVGLLSVTAAQFLDINKTEKYAGVDLGAALLAGTLHDIGKGELPADLLEKSIAATRAIPGSKWLHGDRSIMSRHAELGAKLAAIAGMSREVVNTITNHHALQPTNPIGNVTDLDTRTRMLVFCVAIADFTDASYRQDDGELAVTTEYERHWKIRDAAIYAFEEAFHGNGEVFMPDVGELVCRLMSNRQLLSATVDRKIQATA